MQARVLVPLSCRRTTREERTLRARAARPTASGYRCSIGKLRCAGCGRKGKSVVGWTVVFPDDQPDGGWTAYLEDRDDVAVYCPICAERAPAGGARR